MRISGQGIKAGMPSRKVGVISCAIIVLIAIGVAVVCYWEWLSDGESPSATIRNLILVAAAVIGLPLAIWRSLVAERQVEMSRLSIANERYQKGVEMLSSPELHACLGGIYSLEHLAREHPQRYHLSTLRMFTSYLRRYATEAIGEEYVGIAVAEILRAIGTCSDQQMELEQEAKLLLNFSGLDLVRAEWWVLSGVEDGLNLSAVDLSHVNLSRAQLGNAFLFRAGLHKATLRGAYLAEAVLDGCRAQAAVFDDAHLIGVHLNHARLGSASFRQADLSAAKLRYARLRDAKLMGAIFLETDLEGANISGANLTNCRDLTQGQLDLATASSERPPLLDGAVDPVSGSPLTWRGREPPPRNEGPGGPLFHRIPRGAVSRHPLQ